MVDIDTESLRSVLRRFATGVAVVTTWDGDLPRGTTVNSFCSLSLRPPLVMVAFDRHRRIVPALERTGLYAVNILGENSRALSDCFAGGPGPVGDGGVAPARDAQLCGAGWHQGTHGQPILDDAIASLECVVQDVHPAGDHDLYIARVLAAAASPDQPLPLLYYSTRYLRIERASLLDLEGKPER